MTIIPDVRYRPGMERRHVLLTSLAGAVAGPLAAEAQPLAKRARPGILAPLSTSLPQYASLRQALWGFGYQNDVTLSIEERAAEGNAERLPTLAAELVRSNVDVILAAGPEATLQAARQATSTISNITGVFLQQLELTMQRPELLKEAVPGIARVAVLWDTFSADQWKLVQGAAPSLGVQLRSVELRNPPYDFERAFQTAAGAGARAILALMSPIFFRERAHMASLAAKHRLPAIFGLREWVDAGGFMAYAANVSQMFVRAAGYIDKILRGAKAASLPISRPSASRSHRRCWRGLIR
jgi:putative tryptophan/tyrosine transport system substrate-binding protein